MRALFTRYHGEVSEWEKEKWLNILEMTLTLLIPVVSQVGSHFASWQVPPLLFGERNAYFSPPKTQHGQLVEGKR